MRKTIGQFFEAYAKRDINLLMSVLAPDPDITLIGTGADERRVGSAEIKMQAD